MATFALIDPVIYVADYDFTTDLHQITVDVSAEELDATTFGGGGYRSRIGGLKTVQADMAGYWQSTPDAEAFPDLGTANQVFTVNHNNTEANTAYLFRAGKFNYSPFGTIGGVTPFTLGAMGTDAQGVIRGQLGKKKGNVSATGALGSGVNLGAVGATQFLYASFHVFTAGTTITVQVESATSSAFTIPTTRATIGPLTTTGGTWMTRVAGAITDTWFRFNVSAITGTFSVAGAIGIGS